MMYEEATFILICTSRGQSEYELIIGMEGHTMNRKKTASIIVILCILLLTACGEKPSDPDIKGTITSIEGNGLLIVDKESASPGKTNPTAIWVKFKKDQLKGVKIGYLVNAWSSGVMQESYPMQTEGTKLEIVSSTVGNGDLQGTVSSVSLDAGDESKSYIEVDGKRLSLIPSTDYLLNDIPSDASQIKVGDKVELWFPGYQIMNEQVVTQVRIVR